jgi:hypothetical protein
MSSQRLFLPTIEKRNMEYVFCIGILIGGIVAFSFIKPRSIIIDASLRTELATYGITNINGSYLNKFSMGKFIHSERIYNDRYGFLIGFFSICRRLY